MGTFTRRTLLAASAAFAGVVADRYLLAAVDREGPSFPPDIQPLDRDSIVLNDASELSPTSVKQLIVIHEPNGAELTARIKQHMADAKAAQKPVMASAARHSMGAQSLPRDGFALSFNQRQIELDTNAKTYKVSAGVRWATVIETLDKQGFSPAVMQSNNDFGVASTFSVNAHGWPVPFSGCGSTVRSMSMILADGSEVRCSRTENADLFGLAMGGYGLFGVITELELDMVPNAGLKPTFEPVTGRDLGKRFAEILASDKSVQMAYGRLDVSIDGFFDRGLLITYRPDGDQANLPPATGSGFISHASREIFRAQLGNEWAKDLRWYTETEIGPRLAGISTRNSLINEPVVTLDDGNLRQTDILHEYFVPPDRYGEFVAACKAIIPASFQQLMNITVRYVAADKDSVLAYAPTDRIASVLLFSQEKSMRAEEDMARMTRALIDAVHNLGGTYYLPYRPHATLDQLKKGYPRVQEFVAAKRKFDPGLLFRNNLWDSYLSKL